MVEHAADLIEYHGYLIDPVSKLMLAGISIMDDAGAWQWDLRVVAVTSFLLLGGIRVLFGKRWGVDWYAFLHAVITTVGSFACLYLDTIASEALTGKAEPMRSVEDCAGPLTSLHRILPAITAGYAIFDLIDGLSISFDFVLHGAATLLVMIVYCSFAPHIMAPMIFMEGSTIFLNLVKAKFFNTTAQQINQLCFVVSFFVCRLLVVPYHWGKLIRSLIRHPVTCFPWYFGPMCLVSGMFYHALNAYWFRKILRKAKRRILQQEKHNEKNDFADEADRHSKVKRV